MSELIKQANIEIKREDLEDFISVHTPAGQQFMNTWLAGKGNAELIESCEKMYGEAPRYTFQNCLQGLTELNLNHNMISPEGAHFLAQAMKR
jgi:hypothetical protein